MLYCERERARGKSPKPIKIQSYPRVGGKISTIFAPSINSQRTPNEFVHVVVPNISHAPPNFNLFPLNKKGIIYVLESSTAINYVETVSYRTN